MFDFASNSAHYAPFHPTSLHAKRLSALLSNNDFARCGRRANVSASRLAPFVSLNFAFSKTNNASYIFRIEHHFGQGRFHALARRRLIPRALCRIILTHHQPDTSLNCSPDKTQKHPVVPRQHIFAAFYPADGYATERYPNRPSQPPWVRKRLHNRALLPRYPRLPPAVYNRNSDSPMPSVWFRISRGP